MINITMLDLHSSSPLKLCSNMMALAQRKDLYTGDDFYFGFDSSNQSFLDIIGGKQPLAIKHGPTFSIYRHDVDGHHFEMFLIDAEAKKLNSIINIHVKPSEVALFYSLIPFEFTDFYMNPYQMKNQSSKAEEELPEQFIASVLGALANNKTLTQVQVEQLQQVVGAIDGAEIRLSDPSVLLEKKANTKPTPDDFVAPYNPFNDNPRVNIETLLRMNPSRISVRAVKDNYPRIEIIVPGLSENDRSVCVFKNQEPDLFMELESSLSQPEMVQKLLIDHFPEQIREWVKLSEHSPK